MWLELKPSQNPQYLVSGPNLAQVIDVSSQKEFSDDKVIELDLFRFREKHIPQTECGPLQRASVALKCAWLASIGLLMSYVNE